MFTPQFHTANTEAWTQQQHLHEIHLKYHQVTSMCRCFYHRVRLCLALFVTSWKNVVFFYVHDSSCTGGGTQSFHPINAFLVLCRCHGCKKRNVTRMSRVFFWGPGLIDYWTTTQFYNSYKNTLFSDLGESWSYFMEEVLSGFPSSVLWLLSC